MTCIVGLRDGGIVHMGGDAVVTAEMDLLDTTGPKVLRYPSGLVVGFAGSLATANILARPDDAFITGLTDLDNDKVVNAASDRLQNIANFQLKGAADAQFWVMALVALGPTLVCIGNVAGWYRVKGFRCIGAGSKVATGAMHVLGGLDPRERIERAINAAAAFVPGVGTMTTYETTEPSAPRT